jgi:hypothetical protein
VKRAFEAGSAQGCTLHVLPIQARQGLGVHRTPPFDAVIAFQII